MNSLIIFVKLFAIVVARREVHIIQKMDTFRGMERRADSADEESYLDSSSVSVNSVNLSEPSIRGKDIFFN